MQSLTYQEKLAVYKEMQSKKMSKAGSSKSPAKVLASRENLKKAVEARKKAKALREKITAQLKAKMEGSKNN